MFNFSPLVVTVVAKSTANTGNIMSYSLNVYTKSIDIGKVVMMYSERSKLKIAWAACEQTLFVYLLCCLH